MAEQQDQTFKVTDRRKFNPDGSLKDQSAAAEAGEANATPSREPAAAPSPEPAAAPALEPKATRPQAPEQANRAGGSSAEDQSAKPAAPAGAAPEAVRAQPPGSTGASPASQQTPHQKAAEDAYKKTLGGQPTAHAPAFLAIVNMLAVEAGLHLGMVHMPGQEEAPPIDLEAARQLIDLLGVLQEKTRGNLNAEEENVIEGLLADLRMQFVSLSSR
jgi:hypothetical protein